MNLAAARKTLSESPEAAGSVCVAGETFLCDWAGCLFWPEESLLVVSDLHLEKGSSFARRGQLIPPYDTQATLALLAARIEAWQPRRVISLGDSFHDEDAHARLAPETVAVLAGLMAGRDWIWISGNHDPLPPAELGGDHCEELALGSVLFRHAPVRGSQRGEIAGHLHPQARIVRRGGAVRRRCFAGDGNRLVMPAFGAYTGGLSLRDAAFAGLFDLSALEVQVLGRGRVYRIGGHQLG